MSSHSTADHELMCIENVLTNLHAIGSFTAKMRVIDYVRSRLVEDYDQSHSPFPMPGVPEPERINHLLAGQKKVY